MARNCIALSKADIRAAVGSGQISSTREADWLVPVLLARRAKIVATAFEHPSALGDLTFSDSELCATDDFAIAAGVSAERHMSCAFELPDGAHVLGVDVRRMRRADARVSRTTSGATSW
jgi:hypothetical protein